MKSTGNFLFLIQVSIYMMVDTIVNMSKLVHIMASSSKANQNAIKLSEALKDLLGEKAKIGVNGNIVRIVPEDYIDEMNFRSRHYLSKLCSPFWEEINIPDGVFLHIEYFLYCTSEGEIVGTDPWCVKWFKEKFGSKVLIYYVEDQARSSNRLMSEQDRQNILSFYGVQSCKK